MLSPDLFILPKLKGQVIEIKPAINYHHSSLELFRIASNIN